MSNAITYDSLLVHYLARELDERLRARRLRGVRLDSEHRRLTLALDDERLIWELHPTRGWIRSVPVGGEAEDDAPPEAAEGWGGRRIPTQRRPRVRGVTAPPDERVLEIEIDAGGPDRASRFVVELMTNQWNVLALAPDRRIVAALRSREAGDRALRPGRPYAEPGGAPREGVDDPIPSERFREIMAGVEPGARRRTLVRAVAWTSPLNAAAILAGDDLEEAWRRYAALASRPEPAPRVLALSAPAAYPLPLPGVEASPTSSLLEALVRAGEAGGAPAATIVAPEIRDALEARLERARRRAERLREEAETAPERAAALRRRADLLMAQLHTVERGADRVELDDFEGGTVSVELDPARGAAENAESLYDRAGRRERAARALPEKVREAEAEADRIEAVLAGVAEGTADPAELERWLSELRPERDDAGDEERLPYHRFRSSGGLEIRVGRSGRANDRLTFHHSAPDDVWLHARDVAGAHVILRWGDRDQNPPKRDLLEAAVLAAVHSRARTSGTVPVDWTRRKYVRSPRNAAPGAVIPDRVSTLFVEPDADAVDRLRDRPGLADRHRERPSGRTDTA